MAYHSLEPAPIALSSNGKLMAWLGDVNWQTLLITDWRRDVTLHARIRRDSGRDKTEQALLCSSDVGHEP
ncbi:hypothetical protein N7465_005602 [Penicillium sp. CMV-2018d]|nr:hypothetical protein N7465_005602 [Penicillium sp. CMV-2018d]